MITVDSVIRELDGIAANAARLGGLENRMAALYVKECIETTIKDVQKTVLPKHVARLLVAAYCLGKGGSTVEVKVMTACSMVDSRQGELPLTETSAPGRFG